MNLALLQDAVDDAEVRLRQACANYGEAPQATVAEREAVKLVAILADQLRVACNGLAQAMGRCDSQGGQ